MQIAVIDIGTNTFHLLVSQSEWVGVINHIESYKVPVKLGENGITKGVISEAAFQRGVDAVKYFHEIISSKKITDVYAFATSAMRRAANAELFLNEIKNITGISIEIISGDKEAEFIYYGVNKAVDLGKDVSLIMDIGGGSVEFVLCNDEKIFWKASFDVGAAILLEMFKPSDPVTNEEIEKIKNYVSDILMPLFEACKKFSPAQLVGSSGSFDTLADVVMHRFYSPDFLDGKTEYSFNYDEAKSVMDEIIHSTHAQREKMKGIAAMRIDMIVIGCILIDFVTTRLNIKNIKLSSYALKEGALWYLMKQGRIEV